jgi:predicted MFS family arabinose efflux permease
MLPLALLMRNNPRDMGYGPDGESLIGATRSSPSGQATDFRRNQVVPERGSSLFESFRAGAFWLISADSLICGLGCGFMMTHTVIFATDMGYSEMIGATFLSVQGGANLVGVLLTGHMSDRYARNRVLAMTHSIRGLSFFTVVISVLLGGGSLWLLYTAMALFGFGWFTTAPLYAGLLADFFGYRRLGTLIGINMSCHTVGMAVGAYAGGITFELTGSYFLLFIILGALEFLAASFALAIKRRSGDVTIP